jgi:hypothetical protein
MKLAHMEQELTSVRRQQVQLEQFIQDWFVANRTDIAGPCRACSSVGA